MLFACCLTFYRVNLLKGGLCQGPWMEGWWVDHGPWSLKVNSRNPVFCFFHILVKMPRLLHFLSPSLSDNNIIDCVLGFFVFEFVPGYCDWFFTKLAPCYWPLYISHFMEELFGANPVNGGGWNMLFWSERWDILPNKTRNIDIDAVTAGWSPVVDSQIPDSHHLDWLDAFLFW